MRAAACEGGIPAATKRSRTKAYLQLCRVSNLPTVWTNVLAGCLLSGGRVTVGLYLLLALSLSSFYLAGMVLNDLCDGEHDRQFRPTRPIPSCRVSERAAFILTIVLFAAGFGSLAFAPRLTGAIAAVALSVAILLYDRHHKQNPFSVLLMGSCRFLVCAVAAYAVIGRLTPPVVVAGGIQFLYIVGLSLFARYENSRQEPFSFPAMPFLLAGISLVDGIVLASQLAPVWFLAGAGGFVLTLAGQCYVRGD